MRRTETPKPIWIKFCMAVDIPDVVKYANFGDHQLRGFWVAGGRISPSPIDFHRRPYNTLALPCERVIPLTVQKFGYGRELVCPWVYCERLYVAFRFSKATVFMDYWFSRVIPHYRFCSPSFWNGCLAGSWPISTKAGTFIQNTSLKCTAVKNSISEIQDGVPPIRYRDPFCFIISCRDFSIFKMAAVRHHLGFLKLKFSTAMYKVAQKCCIFFNIPYMYLWNRLRQNETHFT